MKVEHIIITCMETPPKARSFTAKEIDRIHRDQGYAKIGFHYVIPRDGWIEVGRMETEDGAHTPGLNSKALGICLVGVQHDEGKLDPAYTNHQWASLAILVRSLKLRYPRAGVSGKRDHTPVPDSNPYFNVEDWWKSINT